MSAPLIPFGTAGPDPMGTFAKSGLPEPVRVLFPEAVASLAEAYAEVLCHFLWR